MADNQDLIGKKAKPIPVKQKEIGIDTENNLQSDMLDAAEVSTLNTNVLESFSSIAQTREEVYKLIDTMAQDGKVSSVLRTFASDITETNDSGQVVWCESSNEKVSKYVNYLLDSLGIDKHIYGWAYKYIKYGDLYLKLFRESDWSNDLLFGDTKDKSTLNEDIHMRLSDKKDHYVHYVEAVDNPGEMFELTKCGKTMAYIKAPVIVQQNYDNTSVLNSYLTYKMKKNDITIYGAMDFVHAALESDSSRVPEEVSIFMTDEDYQTGNASLSYKVKKGQSLLADTFKVWRQLTLLEDSLMLSRLTKSAIVRILNIDTGELAKDQVNNFISRLKDRIEQKISLNIGDGMGEYTNPGPIDNIIYVPTKGTQGHIEQQTLGGDYDPKSLSDLDRFTNEFYGTFGIPKAFYGWTDDGAGFNGGQSLALISSEYGKLVKNIQNSLCQMITDLINLLLLDKGLATYVNDFVIHMQAPITQEEISRRENKRNRIGVVSDIMQQVDGIVKDELIKAKIGKVLVSTVVTEPEILELLQEQIDLLENNEEKKESSENEGGKDDEYDISSGEPSFEAEAPRPSRRPEPTDEVEETESEIAPQDETSEEGGEESYLPSPDEMGIDLTNIENI